MQKRFQKQKSMEVPPESDFTINWSNQVSVDIIKPIEVKQNNVWKWWAIAVSILYFVLSFINIYFEIYSNTNEVSTTLWVKIIVALGLLLSSIIFYFYKPFIACVLGILWIVVDFGLFVSSPIYFIIKNPFIYNSTALFFAIYFLYFSLFSVIVIKYLQHLKDKKYNYN